MRVNYVARLWRQSIHPNLNLGKPECHGWCPELSIDWVDEPYPSDVSELLFGKEKKKSEDEDEDDDEDYDFY